MDRQRTSDSVFQTEIVSCAVALLILYTLPLYSMRSGGTPGWFLTIAFSFAGFHLLAPTLLWCIAVELYRGRRGHGWLLHLPGLACISLSLWALIGPRMISIVPGSDADACTPPLEMRIRFYHANLLVHNQDSKNLEALHAQVQRYRPDVVLLHELYGPHEDFFEKKGWGSRFAHRYTDTRHPYFGFGIYSRYPFSVEESVALRIEAYLSLTLFPRPYGAERQEPDPFRAALSREATTAWGLPDLPGNHVSPADPSLRVITVHPVAPFNGRILDIHRRLFGRLKRELDSSEPTPVIVTGDFNSVDWSADMLELYRRGLKPVHSPGFKYGMLRGTYSAGWHPIFRLPIDGLLVSNQIKVKSFKLLEIPGSDHLGYVADVIGPGVPCRNPSQSHYCCGAAE